MFFSHHSSFSNWVWIVYKKHPPLAALKKRAKQQVRKDIE